MQAELIDKLAAAKAKTIVNTTLLLRAADRSRPGLHPQDQGSARAKPAQSRDRWRKVIAEAEQALDTDGKLAASMAKAGNVLVPSVFALGEPQGKPDKPLPAAR